MPMGSIRTNKNKTEINLLAMIILIHCKNNKNYKDLHLKISESLKIKQV
jgi:hypothetical protein